MLNQHKNIDDNNFPIFKRTFFEKSIVQTAYSIALHNLDFYPDIISNIWGTTLLYDFKDSPFCWLLKICDTLQEWNKARASNEADYIAPEEINLNFQSDRIIINKYPNKIKLKEKIDKFFKDEEIIQFDDFT